MKIRAVSGSEMFLHIGLLPALSGKFLEMTEESGVTSQTAMTTQSCFDQRSKQQMESGNWTTLLRESLPNPKKLLHYSMLATFC